MNIAVWMVFGIISGLVANWVDPDETKGGVIGSIVLGILGAMLGGLLANLLVGVQVVGFNIASFVVAIMGSLVLLVAGRVLRRS